MTLPRKKVQFASASVRFRGPVVLCTIWGTWVSTDFGIHGDPGASPPQTLKDTCTQNIQQVSIRYAWQQPDSNITVQ